MLAVCAAAVASAVTRLHDAHACERAGRAAFAIGASGSAGPAGAAGRVAADLERSCDGGAPLAAGAATLVRAGALGPAGRLAAEATRRDPRDYQGWIARALVAQRRGDAAARRVAARRALALNPLYPPARALSR
jgi:hypothetical protein